MDYITRLQYPHPRTYSFMVDPTFDGEIIQVQLLADAACT